MGWGVKPSAHICAVGAIFAKLPGMGSKNGKLLELVFLSLCKKIRMGSRDGELSELLLERISKPTSRATCGTLFL
jgi:hypothetical protein